MATRTSQENDYTAFDNPALYIKIVFNDPLEAAENSVYTHSTSFLLKCLAKFYEGLERSDNSLKILDYGCGPSLPYSISAASKASEIVLADYNKWNRKFMQEWVNGEPSAYNWTPYFKYVVQRLEGRSELEAEKRETNLRRKIKAVVACDITEGEFIDAQFKLEYDVVMCFLCIDNVVKDLKGYQSCIKKLFSLIKEGGHLLLLSSLRESPGEGFYTIGDVRFSCFSPKRDSVLETLKETGFIVDTMEHLPLKPSSRSNDEAMMFIGACKFNREQ